MAAAAVSAPERLAPLDQLEVLCDTGSLQTFRTAVTSRRMGDRARAGDGVLAATGTVSGRPVVCFAQDASYLGGSLGAAHADTIVDALRRAGRARVPVVGFVASGGARLQEGTAALAGYGRIFREHVALSGVVPQISVVTGASAGGGAYAPALTDFVVMTREAAMFLTGPAVVAEVMGEEVDAAGLGGHRVHERSGVCHMVAPSDVDAALSARALLDHLPQHSGAAIQRWPAEAPGPGAPDAVVPSEARRVYDVRTVAESLVDGGRLLEIAPKFARNMVCAFARIDGRPVGIVANQPRYLGGVLDADAAVKAARFVRTCNLFGLPLVVLVDTPGFLPGTGQERLGVIRHGAKLVHAFAEATVPRITVVLRKAFGGAFIAMNAKDLGADLVLAWPGAEVGVMGGKQAVSILDRRALAAGADRETLADAYAAEHLGVGVATADGHIDEVVLPCETRDRIAAELSYLQNVDRGPRTTGNIPL